MFFNRLLLLDSTENGTMAGLGCLNVLGSQYSFLRDIVMDLALPLSEMTVAEKLHAIEIIWDDLSRNPENIPSPPWHEEVLAARQKQIDEGQAMFLPLDEFRERIQKEIR
jgi:hypothetical protein